MRKYDAIIITKAELPSGYHDILKEKIENFLKRDNGKILNIDDWGKRKLSYNIKKMNKGHYLQYSYASNGKLNNEMQKYFEIDENILRYQINLVDSEYVVN